MADTPGDDWINDMLAKAMLGDEPADGHLVSTDLDGPTLVDPLPIEADETLGHAPDPANDAAQAVPSGPITGNSSVAADGSVVSTPAPQKPISPADGVAAAAASPLLVDEPRVIIDDDPTGVLSANLSNTDLGLDDADDTELDSGEAGFVRGLLEWVMVLVGAVLVALLLRTFLFQAFWIPSESMEDTLREQDRVLVNKLSYRLHDVNRGDVIVFRRPDEEQAEIRDLIKRVIALPGETVEARDNSIYVNGGRLIEPYLAVDEVIGDFGPVTVPDDELFVMGDNRDESYDSRFFGTVSVDRVVGRAFVLFWPLDRIGTL